MAHKMFKYQTRLGTQAQVLPTHLQDAALYAGTIFVNTAKAASLQQQKAAAQANSSLYTPGKLTIDFAKALSRARMAQLNLKCGGFGWNAFGSVGEWIVNDCFHEHAANPSFGEVVCIGYTYANGMFAADQGGGTCDVAKVGYAPFFFALWGAFMEKIEGFRAVFEAYCALDLNNANDAEEARMLACCMAASAEEAMSSDVIKAAVPTSANVRRFNEQQRSSKQYAPDERVGELNKFGSVVKKTRKTFRKTASFVGAFANPNRVLGEEERKMVPALGEDYILPKEIVTACTMIANSQNGPRPMNNIMLRGDPSVGKTAGARAMAAGLDRPYVFITCNAGTEMYNLIGDMMPVNAEESAKKSINEEMFADLPSATDISMDPAMAYEQITGTEKADASEAECFTAMFKTMMERCSEACANGFKYIESPLVKAIRYGWLCEIQEPSLITRPSVMPGLNGLLDETGRIVLPTGEILKRHPDCVIVSTLNIDNEGCKPLNESFIDRHHLIIDMEVPSDKVIIDRIKGMTGCDDSVNLVAMVDVMHQIAKVAQQRGATDGNTNSLRSLANWAEGVMLGMDYAEMAEYTVVSGATSDPDVRKELSRIIANKKFE